MTDDSAGRPEIPLPRLPPRARDAHKGHFGRALLVGGSRGMSGAIALAGLAALRSGAGLVTLAVPDVCLESVACFEPSFMTTPLVCDSQGRLTARAVDRILELATTATCVACGPGLGRSEDLSELVTRLYRTLERPLVLDADGLTMLAARPRALAGSGGPRILTPHPGEFRRLAASESQAEENGSPADYERQAVDLAKQRNLVLVLKGPQTLVTDGTRSARNATGNPGMATGGSGDVLTGVIAALICQGLPPLDAARLGVHLHGLAGDLAAKELGEVSLIASDLIGFLAPAFRSWESNLHLATGPAAG